MFRKSRDSGRRCLVPPQWISGRSLSAIESRSRSPSTRRADIGPVSLPVLPRTSASLRRARSWSSPTTGFLLRAARATPGDSDADHPRSASLPAAILTGVISQPGDADYFSIAVEAGQQLVFEEGGMTIGSKIRPIIDLSRSRSCACPARRAGPRGRAARAFAHRFEEAGNYLVRVSDYQKDGGKDHFYRIKVGDFRCGRVGLSTRRATRRDGDGGSPRTQPGRRQVLDPGRALVDGLDDRVMLRPDTERRARAFNSSQAGTGRSSGGRGVRQQHGGRNRPAGDGSRDHQRTAEGPTPTTSGLERRRMS